jgi:hypothetical protein
VTSSFKILPYINYYISSFKSLVTNIISLKQLYATIKNIHISRGSNIESIFINLIIQYLYSTFVFGQVFIFYFIGEIYIHYGIKKVNISTRFYLSRNFTLKKCTTFVLYKLRHLLISQIDKKINNNSTTITIKYEKILNIIYKRKLGLIV